MPVKIAKIVQDAVLALLGWPLPAVMYGRRPDGDFDPIPLDADGNVRVSGGTGGSGGSGGEAYPNADDSRQWPQDSMATEGKFALNADGTSTTLQAQWDNFLAFYNAGVVTRWVMQVQSGRVRVGIGGNVDSGTGLIVETGDTVEFNRYEFAIASTFAAEDGQPATVYYRVYFVGSNPTGD